jgi:hypothetical protein
MISIITSISYDIYLFRKKKIIIAALNDLIKNLKKFRINSELIIVANYKDNKKNFSKIKNTNYTNVKYFFFKRDYSQIKSYAFGLNKSKYENILIRDIDIFFNNSIYKFLKKKIINGIYYVPRYDLLSNKLNDLKNKNLFSTTRLFDRSNCFFLNLYSNNCGCFMYFKKKDILKVGFPTDENHSDTLINYSLHLDLGLKQKFIKGAKIYKFINNEQYNDRLKPLKLTLFQKNLEFFLSIIFTLKQISLFRVLFNYPKIVVTIPRFYKFYGGKFLDCSERLFFKLCLKKILPFTKLYKKLNY